MSEATPTQPVVTTTDAPPQAGAEGADARTDGNELENLLKTYDEQTTTPAVTPPAPAPTQPPGTAPDLNVVAGRVQQLEGFMNEAYTAQFKRDMSDTVKAIRGDLDPEVLDDPMLEAWLDVQAKQDPRLAKAWTDRHANPKQFERVKVELGKNLAKKFSKMPDRNVTEDREAVTAAMRGASTRIPEGKAPDYSKMSDAQLREEKDKLFGT